MRPLLVLRGCSLKLDLFGIIIEAHNFLAYARRAPILLFVIEVEHLGASGPTTVVHNALSEHSNQSALPAVHITNDGNAHVVFLTHSQR